MLFRLEIENFCSIRDRQVIDLPVSKAAAAAEPDRFFPIGTGQEERIPSVVAFFGPNAAGKSNVLKALTFVSWFVRQSFSFPPEYRLPLQRFQDVDSQNRPSRFVVWFTGPANIDPLNEEPYAENGPTTTYAYELVLGGDHESPQYVISESLRYWSLQTGKKVHLFRREGERVTGHSAFGFTKFASVLDVVLRPNVSVISTLAQLNHRLSTALWHYASQVVSNVFIERTDVDDTAIARLYKSNPDLLQALNDQIERVDFGIRSLEVWDSINGPTFAAQHEGLSSRIPFIAESHGTKHFVKIFPLVFEALHYGSIALIDEVDASVHPHLLPEILRWFRDPVKNEKRAQLWVTSQNATLLEHLSKEEIFFCQKDRAGRTEIYGLRDIQAVRRDDNFYRKYLDGVYGAVPFIG